MYAYINIQLHFDVSTSKHLLVDMSWYTYEYFLSTTPTPSIHNKLIKWRAHLAKISNDIPTFLYIANVISGVLPKKTNCQRS